MNMKVIEFNDRCAVDRRMYRGGIGARTVLEGYTENRCI